MKKAKPLIITSSIVIIVIIGLILFLSQKSPPENSPPSPTSQSTANIIINSPSTNYLLGQNVLLNLTGTDCGNLIYLDSETNDNQWDLDATGTQSIAYADTEDSNAITANSFTEVNDNNTNWTVSAGLCGGNTGMPRVKSGNRIISGVRIKLQIC